MIPQHTLLAIVLWAFAATAFGAPLHDAAAKGQYDRVARLLNRGADPNVRDDLGFTPLDLARQRGHNRTAKLLVGRGGKSGIDRALVARLQTYLMGMGFDPGPIDGFVGQATRAAIRAYQSHHGLSVSGAIERPWVAHLDRLVMRRIQRRLKALGFDPGPDDGLQGPRTRRALRAFQRSVGLPTTGEVTAEVFYRLMDQTFVRGADTHSGDGAGPGFTPRFTRAHLAGNRLGGLEAQDVDTKRQVKGRLHFRRTPQGKLLGCRVGGVTLEPGWCHSFVDADTGDCRVVLSGRRIYALKCQ